MDHLVEEGILDNESVERIESTHKENAATALLVEDLLTEEALLQALAIVYDAPPAGYSKGLFIERELLSRLDADIVRTHEVIPVRQHGERIDIIVVEPLEDDAREILEDRLQFPIRQYIWPRIRFLQARHYFLGDSLPDWTRPYLRQHPVTLGFATPPNEIDVQEALRSSESLLVDQWRREDVREFLKNCFDRDSLLKVLLGYSGHWLTNRLIVVVGRSGLQPYFMEEWPELAGQYDDVMELRDVRVDPSTIEVLRDAETWQSGSPADLSLEPLFEALGVEKPPLLIGLPLHIGERTAMALLGVPTDTSAGIRLDEISDSFEVGPLQEATKWVGEQLEEMIRRAKSDTLPTPAERIPPLPKNTLQVGLGFEDSLVEENIAKRGDKHGRHRWEIVDISHVTEDSEISEESDSSDDEKDDDEDQVIDAIESALSNPFNKISDASSSATDSNTDDSEEDVPNPAATSFGMPALAESSEPPDAPNPNATSFGMPALQEDSSPRLDHYSNPESEGGLAELLANSEDPFEDEDQDEDQDAEPKEEKASRVDDGWNEILSGVESKSLPERLSDAQISENSSEAESSEPPSSEVLLEEERNEEISELSVAEEASPISQPSEVSEPSEISEMEEEVRPSGPITGVTSLGGFSVADIAEEAPRSTQSKSLNIPTTASGVPMAQIFRRPRQRNESKSQILRRAQQEDGSKASNDESEVGGQDSSASDFDRKDSIAGRTMLGLGEIPNFEDIPQGSADSDSSAEDSLDRPDASSWLDEIEAGAQPSDPEARPGGTVKMDADSARTQTFNELLMDMDSENLPDPNTIPVEVLKEVPDSGPVALEIEESLSLLDSRDRKTAFAAAEHLAVTGPFAVGRLRDLFPGRIFVDRYQYTIENMPPVNEHGPILEALVRIGQPSLKVVDAFLDDASLECRFYATYLLTELPAQGLLKKLFDRLFDRDQQTRSLAQNIIFAHRGLERFPQTVILPLRKVLEDNAEEFRVEIAIENLRRYKDLVSVPLLIETLHEQPKRIRNAAHQALREITFQSFAPALTDWRRWWASAEEEPRWHWLVAAMDSKDDELRMLAFDEIEQLPGVEFNYHPDQPSKLRIRAQKELTEFFEAQQ